MKIAKPECKEGWKCLYEPLIEICKILEIDVVQIKEKFGLLCFYVRGVPDDKKWLYTIIFAVENRSKSICEYCGAGESYDPKLKVTTEGKGWIKTLCEKCRVEWDVKLNGR